GYRLANEDGPGRRDPSYYDLLASEARLASFLAIAKGDVSESHWFHLGRAVTSVRGAPVLLSWGATMFEYLMPLLVMRSYPDTVLDESCRMVVRRQVEYSASRGVPWGISESAYNVVDQHDTYQYKAFGVPGLGLKRGLGDELVVAPFHADPRVQATELLLQERLMRHAATVQPRPLDEMRAAAPPPATPLRRYRSPHTAFPHALFLSNGNYVTIATNAGGGSSF